MFFQLYPETQNMAENTADSADAISQVSATKASQYSQKLLI